MSEVTVTITGNSTNGTSTADLEEVEWEGDLALEGMLTDDNTQAPRFLMPNSLTHRELPLPLLAMFETSAEGHDGAKVVGQIRTIRREKRPKLGKNVYALVGRGVFDSGADGQEALRLVREKTLRGVSVDLVATQWAWLDRQTFAVIEEDEMSIEDYLAGKYALGLVQGSVAAATVAPVQALEHATIGLVASAADEFTYGAQFEIRLVEDEEELIAAAAPPLAPGEWFAPPKFRSLQPLRIDKDGRISGHLAPWNGCHTGFEGICRRPPSSPSNYAVFNVGEIETAEGEFISVGKLMFSDEGGKHAPLGISAARVAKHYDNATKIAGFVRAGADGHGIWLAGTLRTGLSRDEVALIRANPPSGDWRRVNGQLDLVAAFCVCVPGYVVPRADLGMVASAEGEFALDALILGPMVASGEISEFDELLSALIDADTQIAELAAELEAI